MCGKSSNPSVVSLLSNYKCALATPLLLTATTDDFVIITMNSIHATAEFNNFIPMTAYV